MDIQVNHQGEVNKARCMPQSHNIIATKTVSAEIHIFDYFKHPTKPASAHEFKEPQLRLAGHEREGYGLCWSKAREGLLISGSDDGIICAWDVNKCGTDSNVVSPVVSVRDAHSGQVVEDVTWSHFNENEFASVGDDRHLRLWDLRDPHSCVGSTSQQSDDLMCIDSSAFDPYVLVTGSNDSKVLLWDTRNLEQPVMALNFHTDQVT